MVSTEIHFSHAPWIMRIKLEIIVCAMFSVDFFLLLKNVTLLLSMRAVSNNGYKKNLNFQYGSLEMLSRSFYQKQYYEFKYTVNCYRLSLKFRGYFRKTECLWIASIRRQVGISRKVMPGPSKIVLVSLYLNTAIFCFCIFFSSFFQCVLIYRKCLGNNISLIIKYIF